MKERSFIGRWEVGLVFYDLGCKWLLLLNCQWEKEELHWLLDPKVGQQYWT
jgi:hypothetical protein